MSQIPSEARNQIYLDNAPHAVFVVDESGRYIEVNAAACAMTGYDAAELCERRITDLAPPNHGEKLASFVELQQRGKVSVEMDLLRKDGSTVPVALDAVTLPNGHHMAFCVDLSERRRAEEALRASERASERGALSHHRHALATDHLRDGSGGDIRAVGG